jgi:alpha-glucosidase
LLGLAGLALLPAVSEAGASSAVQRTPDGLRVSLGGAQVELAAVDAGVLRLSVSSNGASAAAPSTFLAPRTNNPQASWRMVRQDSRVGIRTQAGRLLLNPASGEWTLEGARGEVLIPPHTLGVQGGKTFSKHSQVTVEVGWDKARPLAVYGCGNGVMDLRQTKGARAGVGNGLAVLPYYWSEAGYGVLAVTEDDEHPASWRSAEDGGCLTWTFPGARADLYLMPAASLKAAAGAYAHLTGAAPVPPRWAFGYLQSQWGWKDRAYIEDTLKRFRVEKIPVDAFIYDFEWYTTKPDYELPAEGAAVFEDFGWNRHLFDQPAAQVKACQEQGVKFVGIRKPRLGKADTLRMLRERHWDLRSRLAGAGCVRDMDFANPELREWYIQQSAGLWQTGADGWWNDEGEGAYTLYYYWNLAEQEALNRYRPGTRLWTLNRAYSPGTQRFGAGAWTGDVESSWKVLGGTPAHLLNWSLAGMPYGCCDLGGFFGEPSPELYSRWMEAGVFFPIMRSHNEVHYPARFPWLYGAEALDAARKAIELRYRLIPFYYSLAHETYQTGLPWMRPLAMEFPGDPRVANLTDQWMVGSSLLAAPVLAEGGKREVYLPRGAWYKFGANRTVAGGLSIPVSAALDEIPLYVRAGSLLPLGPVLQHTGELPGGPLELQVYPGQDATFTLVEDDGETTGYQKGQARRTTFKWSESKRRLSWEQAGEYSGKGAFERLRVVVWASKEPRIVECALSRKGAVRP